MKAYELMLLLDPSLDDEAKATVVDKAQGVVTSQSGTVDQVDDWGKRKMAYEIADKTEANYVVLQVHTTPESVAEIDRVLRITDPVIRFMIVRREDID